MKKRNTIIPPEYAARPFFIIDQDGHITAVNAAAAKIAAIPDSQTGTHFISLFTDPAKAGEMLQQAIAKNKAENFQLSFLPAARRKNTSFYFNAYCSNNSAEKKNPCSDYISCRQ